MSVQVSKCMKDTDGNVMLPSLLINTVFGIPDVSDL